jgi:hypothetical protein
MFEDRLFARSVAFAAVAHLCGVAAMMTRCKKQKGPARHEDAPTLPSAREGDRCAVRAI